MRTDNGGDMNLSLGILIIGSLLWRQTEHRTNWRRNRLDCRVRHPVSVPIRYGRISRGNTYTMVFSCGLENEHLGCAVIVPCIRKVTSIENLIEEAEHLWVAEQVEPHRGAGKISGTWGCVGLLANPDSKIPLALSQGWGERENHEQNRNYGQLDHAPDESPAVNDEGILQIAWPPLLDSGGGVPCDLLLATATKPTLIDGRYATAEEVAHAWIEAGEDSVEYFRSNREHGIITFQDEEIARYLKE